MSFPRLGYKRLWLLSWSLSSWALSSSLPIIRITSCHSLRMYRQPIKRPTYWETKSVSSNVKWAWKQIFWGLITAMWVSLEVDPSGRVEPWDECKRGWHLTATSWDTLSQRHPAKSCLNSRSTEIEIMNICCFKAPSFGGSFFEILFLSNYYTQCWAWTYNLKIYSLMFHWLNQPSAPFWG